LTLVGVLGDRGFATVDARGSVQVDRAGWALDWWIGADDRWHVPADEAAVRQVLVADAPITRTAMRVPGGDAVQCVYGVAVPEPIAVVGIENASPAPFVVALVVRGARQLALDGTTVLLDGRPALTTTRAPSRWAVSTDGSARRTVTTGAASSGPFPPRHDRGARLEAALLYPVVHRGTFRAAVALRGDVPGELDLSSLRSAEEAARGWSARLDQAMRVELPDRSLQATVRAAEAEVLLAAQAGNPSGAVVAALEDWGFDAEARAAWGRLNRRERRRAATRAAPGDGWASVRDGRDAAALLLAVRALLVHETGDGLALLAQWPGDWRGLGLEVHDAPTRRGQVSYAVRWHGDRPAVLWDVPPATRVRAPGLDPSWSSDDATGEALLGPMPPGP
jgi:hypothetical protein